MLHILCYGDSNTWGYDPIRSERLDRQNRWPGVVGEELAGLVTLFEEGLGSRTTNLDDPFYEGKNGRAYLIAFLESHAPLDVVVVMLGTNDLKQQYHRSASEVAQAAGLLVGIVQKSNAGPQGQPPQVLLVAPPPVGSLAGTDYTDMYAGAPEKSRLLSKEFARIARAYGCAFLDAAALVTPHPLDGIHLDGNEHRKLGKAIAHLIRERFSNPTSNS